MIVVFGRGDSFLRRGDLGLRRGLCHRRGRFRFSLRRRGGGGFFLGLRFGLDRGLDRSRLSRHVVRRGGIGLGVFSCGGVGHSLDHRRFGRFLNDGLVLAQLGLHGDLAGLLVVRRDGQQVLTLVRGERIVQAIRRANLALRSIGLLVFDVHPDGMTRDADRDRAFLGHRQADRRSLTSLEADIDRLSDDQIGIRLLLVHRVINVHRARRGRRSRRVCRDSIRAFSGLSVRRHAHRARLRDGIRHRDDRQVRQYHANGAQDREELP